MIAADCLRRHMFDFQSWQPREILIAICMKKKKIGGFVKISGCRSFLSIVQ